VNINNPFCTEHVSDQQWAAYVERYLAERGGADEEGEPIPNSPDPEEPDPGKSSENWRKSL